MSGHEDRVIERHGNVVEVDFSDPAPVDEEALVEIAVQALREYDPGWLDRAKAEAKRRGLTPDGGAA